MRLPNVRLPRASVPKLAVLAAITAVFFVLARRRLVQ